MLETGRRDRRIRNAEGPEMIRGLAFGNPLAVARRAALRAEISGIVNRWYFELGGAILLSYDVPYDWEMPTRALPEHDSCSGSCSDRQEHRDVSPSDFGRAGAQLGRLSTVRIRMDHAAVPSKTGFTSQRIPERI